MKKEKKEQLTEEDIAEEVGEIEAEESIILTPEAEIQLLQEKISELENSLLKEKAEVENFKRRVKQEYETNLKFAAQSMIEKLLPILDGFDRAIESTDRSDETTAKFVKGFEMIQQLLTQILESEGLEIIPTEGLEFDPYLHQAILQETDETKEDNVILEELQKGYKLKDRVVRASMVKVNTKQ